MSTELQQQIAELTARVEKFERLHADFQHWNNSRRGVEGGRGETGAPGRNGKDSEIPGPQGTPGKDADVSEVIAAAKQQMQSDFATLQAGLAGAIVAELKRSGVVDANGKAILVAGPAGRDGVNGQDSAVVGPAGASITGPAGTNGRDAVVKIGSVSAGDQAAASIRVVDGVSYLDIVLPRGERGQAGADSTVPGPQGVPGSAADLTPLETLQADINKQVGAISMQLEVRLRRIFKDDVQAALRGHLVESHKN